MDASLYEQYPYRNTGFDEIVEVGKTRAFSGSVHGLVQFDIANDLSGSVPLGSTFYLNLRVADATNFHRSQYIEIYPITQLWDEGTGFFAQDLVNPYDGVTWRTRDAINTNWATLGGSTGSLIGSHSFGFKPTDIRIDISGVVRGWITGSINYGLLFKLPESDETNSKVLSNIKFFSRNTHTIYPPTIEAVWNSQTMSITPASNLVSTPDEYDVYVPALKQTFASGSMQRIRFSARPIHPIKSFADVSRYGAKYYLSSGSYIGIQDVATKAMVIPFDTGSLLSADNTGSYFDLKIENMFIGRTYEVLVQVTKPWGFEVMHTGNAFRVV
jgi:hypothetical protein